MKTKTFLFGVLAAAFVIVGSGDEASSNTDPSSVAPTQNIYGKQIPADQAEFIVTGERIVSAVSSGSPSAIWEALEHGERVECLSCISAVSPLLYDKNAENREIAAWWLRRRIFGVFGPGEVYEQTLNTLATNPDPKRRAYAASAIGEFLDGHGVAACASAIEKDPDGSVRAAAASALGRLNADGAGALSRALGDGEARVKIAALSSVGRINVFTDVASVARLTGDGDATVRRRAVEVLDTLHARDSVAAVLQLAQSDPDANVRVAACHALATFHDSSARAGVESIAANDKDGFVRDMAQIALRRL